uniref:Uncharacterized protein n=1 Tax=Anguilla anguilla TaxID=7936 RepID=A0A0E9TLL2_ANGAN
MSDYWFFFPLKVYSFLCISFFNKQ